MRIRKVTFNNRKKAFEACTSKKVYTFPYAKLEVRPSPENPILDVGVDNELANEAFTYVLESGEQGTVHIDHVLEYNRDPRYLRDLLLYKLTLSAQDGVERSPLSKRELIRRLGTSPAQFYRSLDQTNYRKSLDKLTELLHVLDSEIDLVVRKKSSRVRQAV